MGGGGGSVKSVPAANCAELEVGCRNVKMQRTDAATENERMSFSGEPFCGKGRRHFFKLLGIRAKFCHAKGTPVIA